MANPLSKSELKKLLSSDDTSVIATTLLDISINIDDWKWAQDECLEFIACSNEDIRGLAITCLGHIARVHSKLEKEKVLSILQERLILDKQMAGRIEDTLQDISMFVP